MQCKHYPPEHRVFSKDPDQGTAHEGYLVRPRFQDQMGLPPKDPREGKKYANISLPPLSSLDPQLFLTKKEDLAMHHGTWINKMRRCDFLAHQAAANFMCSSKFFE